jgi:hypothetical protein
MIRDLDKLIKKYGGLWVAFKPETDLVVSSGKDVKEVWEKAKKRISRPVLFKVPVDNLPFIGGI